MKPFLPQNDSGPRIFFYGIFPILVIIVTLIIRFLASLFHFPP